MKQFMIASGRILVLLLLVMIFSYSALAINNEPAAMRLFPISDYLMGGDVLRPAGPRTPWYLGLDAGITYSSFSGGPILLSNLKNPYRPTVKGAQRQAYADKGNGLGFYIGATIDYPLSHTVGLIGKINYHTRSGKFSSATKEVISLLPPDSIEYHQDFTWSLNYIAIDILLRVQLLEKSLYLLAGPSFAFLQKNTVALNEKIIGTNKFYIEDDPTLPDPLARRLTTLSSETEITNLNKTRIEFKAGLGTWIPVSTKLFLTPEVMVTFPISRLIKNDETFGGIKVYDFNMWTIFVTVGLRWEM